MLPVVASQTEVSLAAGSQPSEPEKTTLKVTDDQLAAGTQPTLPAQDIVAALGVVKKFMALQKCQNEAGTDQANHEVDIITANVTSRGGVRPLFAWLVERAKATESPLPAAVCLQRADGTGDLGSRCGGGVPRV